MKNTKKGFVPILIAIIVIVALGVGGYVYRDKLKTLVGQVTSGGLVTVETKTPSPSVNIATNIDQSTKVTSPLPVTPVQGAIRDCGGDMQCFIRATANKCQLTKLTYTASGPHPFVALAYPDLSKVTASTYYEIKGQEGANCVIYQKLLSGSMTYDQNKLAQISAGKPAVAAQAKAILDSTNEGYKQFVGKDGTCKVTSQEFAAKFNATDFTKSNLSFSTDDPYTAKCNGPLFTVQTQ